jgi:hypothetical protein
VQSLKRRSNIDLKGVVATGKKKKNLSFKQNKKHLRLFVFVLFIL